MRHSNKTGLPIDSPGEQLIQLPLALCDHEGQQNKGQKSYTTKSLETRYNDTTLSLFTSDIPHGWQPKCVLLEGMFLINTKPLGTHKTLSDYAKFLMARHITSQFKRGAMEVHIIFDNPGRLGNTPKHFEQLRRDAVRKTSVDHYCDDLQANTKIPSGNWQDNIVGCRDCKRRLVTFLGSFFLSNLNKYLRGGQVAYVAGHLNGQAGDIAWFVCGHDMPQPEPVYNCQAEETDTRLWLHATKCPHQNILILSPDTDVYHIGLPLPCVRTKQIIVQVSAINSRQLKLLHLPALLSALDNDPDLSKIESEIRPQVMQALYVVSGCDYVSFFSSMGKATFLRYFFQYAKFITGDRDLGTLADTNEDSYKKGYLAFLRLIGTIYFKKHNTAFDTPSPVSHFNAFSIHKSVLEQHKAWLDDIRESVWYRVQFENEVIPSNEALLLHWKRACWVIEMWKQADTCTIKLAPLTCWGWQLNDNSLSVEWDSRENIKAVNDRVSTLLEGCKCATGCTTRRCKCRKQGKECSVGCDCTNCSNTTQHQNPVNDIRDVIVDEEMDGDAYIHSEVSDIVDWIFGEEITESDSDSDHDNI